MSAKKILAVGLDVCPVVQKAVNKFFQSLFPPMRAGEAKEDQNGWIVGPFP